MIELHLGQTRLTQLLQGLQDASIYWTEVLLFVCAVATFGLHLMRAPDAGSQQNPECRDKTVMLCACYVHAVW